MSVTVWDLEMLEEPTLGVAQPRHDVTLLRAEEPAPELARFFYDEVGRSYNWVDRNDWTRADWEEESADPNVHLWTSWRGGAPTGYFVLVEHSEGIVGNTELLYLGLLQRFHGQGLGRWLLEAAIGEAWSLPSTTRLWLHTCSLDGPNARANYLARGFTQHNERTEYQLRVDAG